jgi:hypothetical protein
MKVRDQLQHVFQLTKDPRPLEGLRMPAGSFDPATVQDLALEGLVEFDTRTGILFQTWEEWDLVLTDQGRAILTPKS